MNNGIVNLNYAERGALMGITQSGENIILKAYKDGDPHDELRICSTQGSITIPEKIRGRCGFKAEQTVNVITYPNGIIVIAKIGAQIAKAPPELPNIPSSIVIEKTTPPQPSKNGHTPVMMKGGRVKIPKDILRKAGLKSGSDVAVRLNHNAGIWVDVLRPSKADEALDVRKSVLSRVSGYVPRLDGLKYKDSLQNARFLVPYAFRKLSGIKGSESAAFNVWFDMKRDCIVIEMPEVECDFSHDLARSVPVAPVKVPVCADCAPEVKPDGKADRLIALFENINSKLEALGI